MESITPEGEEGKWGRGDDRVAGSGEAAARNHLSIFGQGMR